MLYLLLQACSLAQYQALFFRRYVGREVSAGHAISDVRIPAKEATGYSGMLLIIYQTALCHILETSHLRGHMKSSTVTLKMNLAQHPSRFREGV
jgi:hypothetical protein